MRIQKFRNPWRRRSSVAWLANHTQSDVTRRSQEVRLFLVLISVYLSTIKILRYQLTYSFLRPYVLLHRDCLKADSAMVMLPELDLELSHGTLGGLYTTVEGLLNKILVQLTATNPFSTGDSTQLHHSASGAPSETRAKFEEFLSALEGFTRGTRMPFTLVLRDPLGNSFVSAPLGSFLPPEADDNLTLEEFERSFEENDEFGLNDIKTSEFESEMPESYGLSDVAAGTGTSNASHAKRVVDHPTFFAKGMEDSTPGGAALTASSTVNSTGANIPSEASIRSDAAANEAWYSTATLPLGWVALKPGQEESSNKEEDTEEDGALKTIVPSFGSNAKATTITVVGRHFSPEDKNLTFMVREEFGGKREGMVFRMGLQGLGYYEDNLASLLLKKDAVIER